MAGFPTHLILTSLLCWLTGDICKEEVVKGQQIQTVSAASGTLKELAGALGGSVTFPLNCAVKQNDTIIWTFNTVSLVIIQPAVKGKEATVIVPQNHYKERIVFPNEGYSLKLSSLKRNDSGVYRVEMHAASATTPFIQEYALHVYEYLSKPKVTMGLQDRKNGTCATNLTCSVDQGGENVTYIWKVMGLEANESHDGSVLPISWRLGEKGLTFVCIAKNPVSSSSSSPIPVRELCKGSANSPNSFRFFLTGLCVSTLLILALVLVMLMIRAKRRKATIKDVKKMSIHREIPNHCLSVGENTVYDTIPSTNVTNPEEEQINTIYSTVKIPKVAESD